MTLNGVGTEDSAEEGAALRVETLAEWAEDDVDAGREERTGLALERAAREDPADWTLGLASAED